MRTSRILVLGVALLALHAASDRARAQKAGAADAERVAAAKELLDVAGSARQFDAVMPMMTQQIQGIFLQMAPRHEKEIREVFASMLRKFSSRKQDMIDQVAVLYAEKFDAAEMREMTRFFRSGVGAKFVAAQPDLMRQSMLIGQRWGERIGREIEAEVRQELKKRGIQI